MKADRVREYVDVDANLVICHEINPTHHRLNVGSEKGAWVSVATPAECRDFRIVYTAGVIKASAMYDQLGIPLDVPFRIVTCTETGMERNPESEIL